MTAIQTVLYFSGVDRNTCILLSSTIFNDLSINYGWKLRIEAIIKKYALNKEFDVNLWAKSLELDQYTYSKQ